LTDAVHIHSRLKQVDASSSLLFNCALECAIRRDKENRKGLEMKGHISLRSMLIMVRMMKGFKVVKVKLSRNRSVETEIHVRLMKSFIMSSLHQIILGSQNQEELRWLIKCYSENSDYYNCVSAYDGTTYLTFTKKAPKVTVVKLL
jgi:hypothetical protein